MVSVPTLWPGETVACLGTGPSLTRADVDALRGKVRVIALNDAHRLAPWADVLYSSDRIWWPRHKGVPEFAGMKYGIGSHIGKYNAFTKHPEIVVLQNTGFDGLEDEPTGLRNGKHSGYAAINLAVHFGASRILLLGYDAGASGSSAHFFGNHARMANPTPAHFRDWLKRYATLVEPLQRKGVAVLNCSRQTAIASFARQTLDQALAAVEVAA